MEIRMMWLVQPFARQFANAFVKAIPRNRYGRPSETMASAAEVADAALRAGAFVSIENFGGRAAAIDSPRTLEAMLRLGVVADELEEVAVEDYGRPVRARPPPSPSPRAAVWLLRAAAARRWGPWVVCWAPSLGISRGLCAGCQGGGVRVTCRRNMRRRASQWSACACATTSSCGGAQ